MIVHTFGLPADLDALMKIASRHDLKVIEDACEAIGAEFDGLKVGSYGDVGVFAFYPNKQITTGEGGMLATKDAEVAATMRSLRNQGRRPSDDWLEHSDLGYNYRISEMNCALGLSQLKRVESILSRRAEIAAEYHRRLRDYSAFNLPLLTAARRTISWFVYVLRLNANFGATERGAIRTYLIEQGIGCGRYFAPIHLQLAYRSMYPLPVELTVTEAESARTLALPFFNRITNGEIAEVCGTLQKAIRWVV